VRSLFIFLILFAFSARGRNAFAYSDSGSGQLNYNATKTVSFVANYSGTATISTSSVRGYVVSQPNTWTTQTDEVFGPFNLSITPSTSMAVTAGSSSFTLKNLSSSTTYLTFNYSF